MPAQSPYLQRRGSNLNFRIAIPADLRTVLGASEIVKSLRTADKRVGLPMALEHAAHVKRAYTDLRSAIMTMDPDKLKESLRKARTKILFDDQAEQHAAEMDQQQREHRVALERTRLETENKTLRAVLTRKSEAADTGGSSFTGDPATNLEPAALPRTLSIAPDASGSEATPPVMGLKRVIDEFLKSYPAKKFPDMYKKHKAALGLLLEIVGDKPVTALRQSDIKGFFDTLQCLPPRWRDQCRKLKISVKQLAAKDNPQLLGPKTFKDTYKASIRPFLADAINNWQDQGFPAHLTTDGNEYRGDREKGENKQRGFTPEELKALFEGPQMKAYAADAAQAHRFWLPHIGLFTGARVNEICQINPMTDIIEEPKTGILYMDINDQTEGDGRINKRTKNKTSRRTIPVHSKLIELGIREYFSSVKARGAKLLFPEFLPVGRRASGKAEKWFREFLRDAGLRDETPGERIVGMHAFRSTLLSHASNLSPPLDATSITGHVPLKGKVIGDYEGKLALTNKQKLLEQITFDLEFHIPVAPCPLGPVESVRR